MLCSLARHFAGNKALAPRKSAQLLLSRRSFAKAPQVDDEFEKERTFTEKDVATFLRLTGDDNLIHTDHAEAVAAGFPGPILPGMLCASLFPALIAEKFPGAVYLSQVLKFRHYAEVGSRVQARVIVEQVSRSQVKFDSSICNEDGVIIINGSALAMIDTTDRRD